MLIRSAEIEGQVCDVRLRAGRIEEIGQALEAGEAERVYDAKAHALLPGLHDHHIHLQAAAAAMGSVMCGPPEVRSLEALSERLCKADGNGWLRGVGYHESIGFLDRDWLDAHGPDRPVRIQHRGGRMWVLNSHAIDLLSIDGSADGRLVDADGLMRNANSAQRPDLEGLKKRLLSYGITGVTDTTPGNDLDDLGYLSQTFGMLDLVVMGGAGLHGHSRVAEAAVGPLKLHYHDHDLPPLDALAGVIARAHRAGRNAAIHCVTRAETMLALAAFEQAGCEPGDRLEHAAVADHDIAAWIARLGLTVVTQPHFVRARGDAYLRDVDPRDLPDLWPLRRFVQAGVGLAISSDAPFGILDPWQVMDAATRRPEGLLPEEAIGPEEALASYTKPAGNAGGASRKIAVGEPASLCLINRSWREACADLGAVQTTATWIAGELAYGEISSTRPQSSAV